MTIAENNFAQGLGALLEQRHWSLATAESCTGGLIGHIITDVSGSSSHYIGGIIAYSNDVKQAELGVAEATLNTVGAVSEETARAMASGVRARLHADVGVATTGIAGPNGGSATKPVGLVYIAVATPDATICERFVFDGDRHSVKHQAAQTALRLLQTALQ